MEKVKLFINGEVVTVNANNDVVEAVAVKGDKILAVGTTEEVLALNEDGEAEVIDLAGKTLTPGLIDAHLHVTTIGTNTLSVSCKAEHIHSIEDILTDLRKAKENTPKGEWIRAWGFNESKIAEKRYPTIEELDAISKEHPILVVRTCTHISVANSYTLQLAGIDKNTPNPEGGIYEKNEQGDLTGLLIENAHMNLLALASFSDEELDKAHAIASDLLVEKGITSIHDATSFGPRNMRALQKAALEGLLKPRVYAMVGALNNAEIIVERMLDAGIYTGLGNEKYKIGPVKLFLDGSSSGPTIWTKEPYTSDPNNYGVHYYEQEFVDKLFVEAHKQGWQITVHAQGDAAIDMILNTIEKANEVCPRPNARHRIEHAGIATPDLIERMKKQGIIPTPNPAFLYEFGDGYLKNYGERTNHMFPLKDYLEAEIPAAITSDSPVTDFAPMRGIHAALTRKAFDGQEVGANQSIDLMDAIRMYTINAAHASFDEEIKGSIEVGKLADLVIFDRALLEVETEELLDVQVAYTMIGGEIVYQRES
ncbi:amidohydrolase [Ornithinibacillus sp. 4-3]|uniref:Amidohydrolase n=1 Tax=Ornithinibacillus sp. 4-3 TaxID=3231488 RepID=A0AB39HPJ1_9BACI